METSSNFQRFANIFLILAVIVHLTAAGESAFNAFVGSTVVLPCNVDTKQCGALHSVKWYRDLSRIYVFSHAGGIARAEGDATDRMMVEYTESSLEASLKISPVEIDDEATYKCEITYLEVRENCDVVQIVKLTTLVKPTSVMIRDNEGSQLVNSSILGPKDEGTDVEIVCEAAGGKPVPMVKWYNRTTELKWASYSQTVDRNGTGTGRSRLKLTLSKGDLATRFECRVESAALPQPIISFIVADVHVRPTKMEVNSVNRNAIAGMKVMLLCDVHGARPAAEVKWFNGTIRVDESLYKSVPEDNRDGTYTTKSTLEFVATRYENGKTFHCNAENQVTRNNKEPALHGNVLVEIQYPPVVSVSPTNITVNETANPLLSCSYVSNPQELQKVIWSKDERNLTISEQHYEGGTVLNPPLRIRNVSREDMGTYNCWLENSVDMVKSENSIYLNVIYPPVVTVIMEPSVVKAVDKSTVILECNVTTGNPLGLQKVRWYLGGELMKELPECNYTVYENGSRDNGGPFCIGVDPSILKLESVQENFAGNYTCQGMNSAGWGAESEPQKLVVYYPPSPAKLRYYPSKVVKSASVNLECTVDDSGRPENTTFLWYRGSHLIKEITTSNWTISPVTLETRSNFTCIPQNDGGQGKPDTVEINVDAPPSFIQNLSPYQGVLYNSKNISLTCRVECWPVCSIVWFIDGKPLDKNTSPRYYVRTEIYPSDVAKNDFESVESTLIWNLTAWPNNQLDKSSPNTKYTCQSFANGVGPGVSSSSEVAVDYAPEDVGIFYKEETFLASNHVINVIEGKPLTPVKCIGKGHPTLNFLWRKNDTSEPIKSDTLQLTSLTRYESASYLCEASNKHGTATVKTYFNVQFVPECSVTIMQKDGKPTLLCIANANPQEVTFTWRVEESNDTYIETENIVQEGLNSYLFLDPTIDTARTYFCYVNNTVGISAPCEKSVAGARPWWNNMEDENKIIVIIASSAVLILCVLIVCIIIIILCRRKRANTKFPDQSYLGDKRKLGAAPLAGHTADPSFNNENDRGFYENLPFHSMQTAPNKPISVIAPFNQSSISSPKSPPALPPPIVKRNQSFSGFPRPNHLTFQCFNNFPTLNQTAFRPFFHSQHFLNQQQKFNQNSTIPPSFVFQNPNNPFTNSKNSSREKIAVVLNGKNSDNGSQSDSELSRKFSTLEHDKKHKCYSPTFHSLKCRKHSKKRTLIYTIPKKVLSDGDLPSSKFEIPPRRHYHLVPIPAPRCKKHSQKSQSENSSRNSTIVQVHSERESEDTCPKLVGVSPKKNIEIPSTSSLFKPPINSCNGSNVEIQKGALSRQIQAKIKAAGPSPNPSVQSGKSELNENSTIESPKTLFKNKISPSPNNSSLNTSSISDTEIPRMPLLDTSEHKWSPKFNHNSKNAFYTLTAPHSKQPNNTTMDLTSQYSATIPHHPKHAKLIPRALFQDQQQISKSKSFSSKTKQKKHFQIPLQKCHSFKFQTAESYFQPIKNLHEENLIKNGYVDNANNRRSNVVEKQQQIQRTNGPLVLMRPPTTQPKKEFQESINFQENVQSSVHLQYPQPGLNSPIKPNGLVYADLDMPKSNKKKTKSKQQKHKPKTEYATLQFNDIGQEIDV